VTAARLFPILDWGRRYDTEAFSDDALAAVVVTIMLIPQSLAYALIAGLPPEIGLYASVAPLIAYALLGTSRTLAVGPVAVISLMTATAIGRVAEPGTADYVSAAFTLAFLSGAILVILGLLRLGALANFLSHPVIAGFIAASALLIAASQLGHLLGVQAGGDTMIEVAKSFAENIADLSWETALIGAASLVFLIAVRSRLKPALVALGAPRRAADVAAKAGPILAVIGATGTVAFLGLADKGVAIVGDIPRGLPPFTPPLVDLDLLRSLLGPALLISVIGFVESVSVAQTLAAKRRQRIEPNQELIALGGANLAAGLTGGYPVTGGFARSVVNFDAGARTPAAGAMTAIGILLAALFLTPLLHELPKAALAATIIVAVLSIVDVKALIGVWRYSRADGIAMATTILGTLVFGVETGILAGVVNSLILHINRSAEPHSAIVGQVPGTEHFRNIERHNVVTSPEILTLRVDESLYFANSRFLEDKVYGLIAERPVLKHFILLCPAVNEIDASGLDALRAINARLKDAGVLFHLSEVKGPVMDRLAKTDFLKDLSGRVFLTQYGAISVLDPDLARRTLAMTPSVEFESERNGGAASAEGRRAQAK
jgi:SulP family sulfate permease